MVNTSPRFRLPRARQANSETLFETNRTDPSHNSTFTPCAWALLARVEAASPEQWRASLAGERWPDGSEMTLASVFAYRYRDRTHHGGHAEEIEEWLAHASSQQASGSDGSSRQSP